MNSTGLLKFKFFAKVNHVTVNNFIKEVSDENGEFILILDNAPAHARCTEVPLKQNQSIKRLPAYSPMLNPIEEMFSSVKAQIKRKLGELKEQILNVPQHTTIKEHRANILKNVAEEAFNAVTAVNCGQWERHMCSFIEPCQRMDL